MARPNRPIVLIAVSILALALGSPSTAKEEAVKLADVPEAVVKAVKQRFPQAELKSASREEDEGATIYELQLVDKKHKLDVSVSPEGELREIERRIDGKDLPEKVRKALQAKYPDAKLQIAEELIRVKDGKDAAAEFEVKLLANGKKLEVLFAADGQINKVEEDDEAEEEGDSGEN